MVRRLKDVIILQTPKENQKEVLWFINGGGGQT